MIGILLFTDYGIVDGSVDADMVSTWTGPESECFSEKPSRLRFEGRVLDQDDSLEIT